MILLCSAPSSRTDLGVEVPESIAELGVPWPSDPRASRNGATWYHICSWKRVGRPSWRMAHPPCRAAVAPGAAASCASSFGTFWSWTRPKILPIFWFLGPCWGTFVCSPIGCKRVLFSDKPQTLNLNPQTINPNPQS